MKADSSERVTWGYLSGALLVMLAFANLGPLLMLLAPFAYGACRWAAGDASATVGSHLRFVGRTWIGALLAYLLLYALLLFPALLAIEALNVVIEAAAAADPGAVVPTVMRSLQAWLSTAPGWPLAAAVLMFVLHGLASFLIATWLAVRLIRRWLRWTDRLPA